MLTDNWKPLPYTKFSAMNGLANFEVVKEPLPLEKPISVIQSVNLIIQRRLSQRDYVEIRKNIKSLPSLYKYQQLKKSILNTLINQDLIRILVLDGKPVGIKFNLIRLLWAYWKCNHDTFLRVLQNTKERFEYQEKQLNDLNLNTLITQKRFYFT